MVAVVNDAEPLREKSYKIDIDSAEDIVIHQDIKDTMNYRVVYGLYTFYMDYDFVFVKENQKLLEELNIFVKISKEGVPTFYYKDVEILVVVE